MGHDHYYCCHHILQVCIEDITTIMHDVQSKELSHLDCESATNLCLFLTDLDNHKCQRHQNCTTRCWRLKQERQNSIAFG